MKMQFEALPHVGKKRAAMLLKQLGSLEKVKTANAAAVSACAKVSLAQAEEIISKVNAV